MSAARISVAHFKAVLTGVIDIKPVAETHEDTLLAPHIICAAVLYLEASWVSSGWRWTAAASHLKHRQHTVFLQSEMMGHKFKQCRLQKRSDRFRQEGH